MSITGGVVTESRKDTRTSNDRSQRQETGAQHGGKTALLTQNGLTVEVVEGNANDGFCEQKDKKILSGKNTGD